MIQIKDYAWPQSLEEADRLLGASRNAAVIGGGAYLRLGSRNISTAIDLGRLGLDAVEESEDGFVLGAMVTLGDLERSDALDAAYRGIFRSALCNVVGVQLRNSVTVGGTVFSRYGFSDLLPPLLALDASVQLHRNGHMKLADFLAVRSTVRDILTRVLIPRGCTAASFQSVRLSTGDYAILNLALACMDGSWRVAAGARPGRAALAERTMDILNMNPWNPETLSAASECISEELTYGTNTRGSAAYRSHLAGALLKKAMREVSADADRSDR